MSKYEAWFDSLNPSTQEYLKNQPLWHDIDLAKAAAIGAVVGFLIGLLF
jgi:ElaB/YqjD/DUF883 family membrane-anchored ribosome-binding protein